MAGVLAVIPVRYGAQRFPGKPLAAILGRPMIEWVVEGVSQSSLIQKIIVATDHEDIAKACENLPVEVVMTDSDLPSGSDRVFQAVKDSEEELIINIQGDEPLIGSGVLDPMVQFMSEETQWDMVTLGRPMTPEALESPNTAKIVLDQNDFAIYFSRFAIPYSRVKSQENSSACLKHLGIYGYKKSFLKSFCETPAQAIEKMEGLEQLRALYLGGKIKVLRTDYESWGVDTPEDIPVVEDRLRKRNG